MKAFKVIFGFFIALVMSGNSSLAQVIGANMNNPIIVSPFAACGGSFSDTKNNSTTNGFGNDYGQSSDDIYYQIVLNSAAQVNISLCSSTFDTYLHLLNASGTLVASNDDNGPLCSGTASSLSVNIAAGTYYIVAEGYSSNSGDIYTNINVIGSSPAPTVGLDMSTAIDIGVLGSTAYSDSRDNSCYLNDYGHESPDIFYKFTLNQLAEVQLSHCGSGFDTYMYLLNSNGTLLASNDDNGPLCTGLQSSISLSLSAGTYYLVSEGYGTYTGVITTSITKSTSNDDKNWIANLSYDEDGNLMGESRTFYDNVGSQLQTQVRNISAGNVLAQEVVYDALRRPSIITLAAPINSTSINYKKNFVGAVQGSYNFTNFDLSKTNTPDTLGTSEPGTLGWYYSNNNTLEPYNPTTGYPYSRTDYYDDGTGMAKRSAIPGDELRMGKGHETMARTFPVHNELNHYLAVRNKFFTSNAMGLMPVSLDNKANQAVSFDANGAMAVSIQDVEGRTLMTALPGSWMSSTSSIVLSNYTDELSFDGNHGDYVKTISIKGAGNAQVSTYAVGTGSTTETVVYTGLLKDYVPPSSVNGSLGIKIKSDKPFTLSYSAVLASGGTEVICDKCASITRENVFPSYYLYLLKNGSASLSSGTLNAQNVLTGASVSSLSGISPGLYRIALQAGSPDGVLTFTNAYADISYNFYNQLGYLVASIAPEGVKKLTENIGDYPTLSTVPFVNTYEYDMQGRLTATTSPDAGRTEYAYRIDGNIRFSQNSEQRKTGRFSYVNYDEYGRAIESGEYIPGNYTFLSAKSDATLLEFIDPTGTINPTGGLNVGTKQQWVRTHYDLPDNSHGLANYTQDPIYLRSAVSWTENVECKTWYNYDGNGRLSWIVKKIGATGTGPGIKTVDYTYNAQGNISKVEYQKSYLSVHFVHEYEYDADGRLSVVYTSRGTDAERIEQARYFYYLHGPLKRIELGVNAQGIDYVYTAQGWLKTINHPGNQTDPGKDYLGVKFPADAFSMSLEYFNGDYKRSGTGIVSLSIGNSKSYFDGNVSAQSWRSIKPNSVVSLYGSAVNNPAMFTYEYDDKYQFSSNKYGAPNFTANSFAEEANKNREYGLAYDSHGNIKTLNRTNNAGVIQNSFSYTYPNNSNKLSAVSNYASFKYDALGQMTGEQKASGGGLYLTYGVDGKVLAIYSDSAKTVLKASFGYDEYGNRVRKTDHVTGIITYYVPDASGNVLAIADNNNGNSTFLETEIPIYGAGRIGRYVLSSPEVYQYELNDNLRNVRVVINHNRTRGVTETASYSDYYPFGSPMTLLNSDYRYGYQGQYAEVDKETGWNNFEARMYDPAIGRWMSTDPAGQFYSPYVGMGNNPVTGVDPDGEYTKWGAAWRRAISWITFGDPTEIYEVNGEWGYNAGTGPGANFHQGYSNGLTGNQQIGMGLRNYGGDYSNSFSDWSFYMIDQVNQFNPITNLWDVGTGLASGKDRLGNPQGSLETNFKFASVLFVDVKVKVGGSAVKAGAEEVVHGNSLKSLKPTWGYKLYAKDGTFLKNGITSKLIPETRYTKAFMSDKYMEAIPFPNRLSAYQWEFQQNQILRGPFNLNMH